jgi:hypothetical protein
MAPVISYTIIRQPMWVVDESYGQKFAKGVLQTFYFVKMGSADILSVKRVPRSEKVWETLI